MFRELKIAVAQQLNRLKKYELFRVQIDKNLLWETYLNSFPSGTNPIYKERTNHDCNCCKQFIRAIGDMVAIVDGKIESIWDVQVNDPAYKVVASALSELVKSRPIENVFLHTEKTAGTDKNFQQLIEGVKTWEHFFVNIPTECVCSKIDIGGRLSESRSLHNVLFRSLVEITNESIDMVLELISQNSLYRGEEHTFVVKVFKKVKKEFDKFKNNEEKDIFVWSKISTLPESVSKIRNTVIGSLLIDLSEGKDLEPSVGSFESKVAPTNYKRPTALITKGMIEQARKKIEELGLTSALERRFATIKDITINNIIFANREARKGMSGDIFDDMVSQVPDKIKNLDKIEEITIDKFISDVVPKADSIEIMMENKHTGNLMSLIAPVDPTAKKLFKWPNSFSWSYNGELTDSIKERVKKAGGNVTGDLCCRLAWYNEDDLDFHMVEPGRYEIEFGNKRRKSPCGGILDIDANGGDGIMKDPVENIYYTSKNIMKEGIYKLFVHQYNRRKTTDVGFEVEIDFMGTIHHFFYPKPMKTGDIVVVAELKYSHSKGIEFIQSLPSSNAVKEVWGISTNVFNKVSVIMNSPNHWDEKAVGNKHYFFMINGCLNDGKARGFFNEFLTEELNEHRKVFEVVGSKMKTEESQDQLSGLGFSSTQRNSVLCRVKGAFTRTIKINF
jgi:hypothetical protein